MPIASNLRLVLLPAAVAASAAATTTPMTTTTTDATTSYPFHAAAAAAAATPAAPGTLKPDALQTISDYNHKSGSAHLIAVDSGRSRSASSFLQCRAPASTI